MKGVGLGPRQAESATPTAPEMEAVAGIERVTMP